jgi:glycosyltransferase involved in cell wall biosynthesis
MNDEIRHQGLDDKRLVSIVIPTYNEATAIENTIRTVNTTLEGSGISHEMIVVDDGSRDGTYQILQNLANEFKCLKAIRFSRNFGKEAALLAGLKAAAGDAVITMDGDLQHPAETIPLLVEKWRQGYKVVHAVKESRNYDSAFARWRANLFNRIFKSLGGIDLKDSSDFILMDRTAKDVIINNLPERMRFYRGLVHWIGFDQATIHFKVAERWDKGQSKWSLIMLFNLATTALVSFSSVPLRIITGLGVGVLLVGITVGMDALISWYLGKSISGFATTIGTLLIIGSFIMISLGIIGEYLAKIYEEIKARPTSVIEDSFGIHIHSENNLGQQGTCAEAPLSEQETAKII